MINFLDEFFDIEDYSCADSKWFPIFELAKFIIVIIQIAVPFALIIWGSLDWFKALIARDEKEMRIKRKPFIARVVAALIVLILPWIVQLISNHLSGQSEFWTCYTEAKPKVDFKRWNDNSFWADDYNSSNALINGDDIYGDNGNTKPKNKPNSKDYKNGCSSFKNTTKETCDNYGCNSIKNSQGKYDCIDKTSNNSNEEETNKQTKLHCTDYKDSCPPLDDFGAVCEPIEVGHKVSEHSCDYKHNPVSCEKIKTEQECHGTDDYGNTCIWDSGKTHGDTPCYSQN